MSQLAHPTAPSHAGSRLGTTSIVMGALALLSVAWLAYLTFGRTGPESNLVRALGMAPLPIGLVVGIPTGILAVRRAGAGRTAGIVGLLLSVLTIVAFVVLINAVDY